jgi:8-oxo-dGTP pyrophosphatase MutT (NUDIX family)
MALLQKVAVLVTRPGPTGPELLVFEHTDVPAGVQVPAGTVEPGEDVRAAALRELVEETGIVVDDVELLWTQDEVLEPPRALIAEHVPMRASPGSNGDIVMEHIWRLGVRVIDVDGGWARIAFEEFDLTVEPWRVVSSVEGWVPASALDQSQVRHVFHAIAPDDVADTWDVWAEDMYTFRCRWVPFHDTGLIPMQQAWIDRARPLLTAREA